ncbi:calcium-binding protein [Rhizobium leguminosarum]|uniref:calcium-binding protein n=1 Tax=Rhizobium leguminosarum TaxID=384 RepID=UPI0010403D26|nr:calcium-binding protein [Rhizobium leguminosarum]TBY26643.1 hypothetical protein E0H30_03645 [Rhizobium leguminosarum bv. viciae]TBY28592.1 hypothetical protein E0H37_13935 [Rhizobium leguminosarum bv. viciae]TBZ03438.1 hypothetical protein E0H49_08635 [Rhizobium leguminosarum bv. viciae]
MAIDDVFNSITFTNFSTSEENEIKVALAIIYSSGKGETLLEELARTRTVNYVNNYGYGNKHIVVDGKDFVGIDKEEIEEHSFIDDRGKVFAWEFVDIVLHETIHAVKGFDDNVASNYVTLGWDYVGDVVRLERDITAELNMDVRNSYEAVLKNIDLASIGATVGQSLTFGRQVDLVLSDIKPKDAEDINVSDREAPVLVIGGHGDDSIRGGKAGDFIYGGVGQDRIIGHSGVDILFGNDGDDVIIGGTGNFGSIEAGLLSGSFDKRTSTSDNGADYLTGGAGNDKFFVDGFCGYASAFQYDAQIHDYSFNQAVRGTFDVIRDFSPGDSIYVTVENADWMRMETVAFSAFALQNAGFAYGNKAIYVATTGTFSLSAAYDTYFDESLQQSITVLFFFEAELRTPIFGLEYHLPTLQQGSAGDDTLIGTAWSDEISGGDGDDALEGGNGSDELTGGKGSDLLDGGGGSDTYHYAEGDGIDVVADAGDSYSKDFLQFSDLNFRDLTFSKSGDDLLIVANDTSESIRLQGQYRGANEAQGIEIIQFAGGGRFELDHAIDTNWITGSSGADSLQGASGRDYMIAGEGADQISGGAGNDFYIYRNGDGSDTIDDGSDSQQAPDVLQLIDLWNFQVTLERDGDDLQVITANGDTIIVKNQFRSDSIYSGIERIEFADGSALGLTDIMAMFPNVTDGTDDDDTLVGTIRNDVMKGFDGDDQFDGLLGDDVLDGGLGNDFLNGGEGSDVYQYAAGDGSDTIADVAINVGEADVLRFSDLNIGNLTFSRAGEDLFITVNSTGQVITVETQYYNAGQGWALERLEFADGTSLQLDHLPDTNWIYGTAASETIDGNWGKDYITAGQGDDIINGSAGGDVYIYASGDGNDLINDEVGFTDAADVLRFTDLNASDLSLARHGDDLELTIVATGNVVTLKGQMFEDPGDWGVDKIEFADGASWDRDAILENGYNADDTITALGTSGDDVLNGTSAHDLFWGGQGNDFLLGGYGGDTYLYSVGDGSDYIDDEANSPYQLDVLKFIDLNEEDISAVRDGVNLKLTVLSTGDTINLDEQFYSSTQYWGIEKIEFADGSFWDRRDILSIEESGTNLSSNQLVQSTRANATEDDGLPQENVIQFPEAGLEVNVTNHDLPASAFNQMGSTSADADTASAEIISLSDFLRAAEHMNTATDLWYEPEPIGAVI